MDQKVVILTLLNQNATTLTVIFQSLGFPLFMVDPSETLKFSRKYIGLRWDVKELLDKLEKPIDVIGKIIEEGKYD